MPDHSTSPLLAALAARVVVADGVMGTALQGHELTLDDFARLEGGNEIFNVTRSGVVRGIHRGYLEADADAGEYGIADRIAELAEAGALAPDTADEFATPWRSTASACSSPRHWPSTGTGGCGRNCDSRAAARWPTRPGLRRGVLPARLPRRGSRSATGPARSWRAAPSSSSCSMPAGPVLRGRRSCSCTPSRRPTRSWPTPASPVLRHLTRGRIA